MPKDILDLKGQKGLLDYKDHVVKLGDLVSLERMDQPVLQVKMDQQEKKEKLELQD